MSSKTCARGLALYSVVSAEISCSRVALRNARMNFRLCLVALLNDDHLPRITVHEYRLATSSSNSTKMAIGPMLLIISASALKPCVAGAVPWLVPLSACKKNANVAVRIANHLIIHGIRRRSRAQVTLWVPPLRSHDSFRCPCTPPFMLCCARIPNAFFLQVCLPERPESANADGGSRRTLRFGD